MIEQEKEKSTALTTGRLEAFSDGVFAIAITLLILEIKIPDQDSLQHESLFHYLWKLWPKYFAYIFSFIIIGIYWANHHFIFRLILRTNHTFNIMNVLFLMTISFLPFPTAIFGEYINDIEHRGTAVTFYSLGIFLPSLVWLCMWLYASRKKRLIDKQLSERFILFQTRLFLASIFLYFLAIIISLFNTGASIALSILLTLTYLKAPRKPEYS